jgi:hypothetical protein
VSTAVLMMKVETLKTANRVGERQKEMRVAERGRIY